MFEFYSIYQNHMIFQQKKPIVICGEGSGEIGLLLSGADWSESASVYAKNGKWRAEFKPRNAQTGLSLTAESCGEKRVISDVAIGEVWLAAGQSNMECDIEYCTGTEEYEELFGSADVRILDIEQDIAFSPRENGKNLKWERQTCETAQKFSAIGGIFAFILAKRLGVPVGIVKGYRGGNCIATFVSEKILRSRSEYGEWVSKFEDEKKELKSAWSMVPCGFFNAMTKPLEPLSFAGVLWYQGESDSAEGREKTYRMFLKDLFSQWREMFGNQSLPIISVMLPPFSQPPFDYKIVRQIQLESALADENTFLISACDMGAKGDDEGWCGIHPKFKTPIAKRAASAALSEVYGVEYGAWRAPVIKKIERTGCGFRLVFSDIGEGLRAEPSLKGFTASCDGVDFFEPDAEIADGCVIIRCTQNVRKICYCYVNCADRETLGGTLTNENKIPAFPFCADVSLI